MSKPKKAAKKPTRAKPRAVRPPREGRIESKTKVARERKASALAREVAVRGPEKGGGFGWIEVEKIRHDLAFNSRTMLAVPERDANLAPRETYTDKELEESIRENGILEPLICRSGPNGELVLTAGFRRKTTAERINPYMLVPYVVREESEIDARFTNLAENIHRADLRVADLAATLARIQDETKKSAAEIARKLGLSESHVQNLIRIKRKLHPDIWDRFVAFGSSIGWHEALEVAKLPLDEQVAAWNERKLHEKGGRAKGTANKRPDPPEKGRVLGYHEVTTYMREVKRIPGSAEFKKGVFFMGEVVTGAKPWPI